ncbi:MAG: GIY-YIG nuclease family protein [Desulfobulbaceae bacterium]|nr:GIY-YIG nuclease family protein [Desulfobulbaceae bacterium]
MTGKNNIISKERTSWFVYIIRCSDDSLYTGITTDLCRRMNEHNFTTKGARYTRARRPVQLVYFESATSRSGASKREYLIKKLTPAAKKKLIQSEVGQQYSY